MASRGRYLTIGDVAEICGVAVVTVRSWERRYGWPEAVRSRGAHRRYLARDRDVFVKLAELRRSMSTSRAIRVLHESQSSRSQPTRKPVHSTRA